MALFSYPVRNYKCPFCGSRMITEEYSGFEPWKCPSCSTKLQISARRDYIVQLVAFGGGLIALYMLGWRGWQLFMGTIVGGIFLTFVLVGPLERFLPAPLEPYSPPPWKKEDSENHTSLFPRDDKPENKKLI